MVMLAVEINCLSWIVYKGLIGDGLRRLVAIARDPTSSLHVTDDGDMT
jgi:hypothetical protein